MRTIMQSSIAMQQSYTRGPRQLFLSSERGGEGGGGREQAAVGKQDQKELQFGLL